LIGTSGKLKGVLALFLLFAQVRRHIHFKCSSSALNYWDCRLSRGIEKRERHHFCRNGVAHGFDSHLDLQRGAY
jgi:hypothetical protein